MSDPSDPLAEIRASFFVECEELLEALQDGLEAMSNRTSDAETINIVFRAVHSIKGGAGAFGLEALVDFAHHFETALDQVRRENVAADDNALALYFRAFDHLSDLVRDSREDTLPDAEKTAGLVAALEALAGAPDTAATSSPAAEPASDFGFVPVMLDLSENADMPAPPADMPHAAAHALNVFRIAFHPHPDLYETGNEPLHLLRALSDLGTCDVTLRADTLPALPELKAEVSYLHWDIRLQTAADAAEIQSVFEFVEGLCDLKVEPEAPGKAEDEIVEELQAGALSPDKPPPGSAPPASAGATNAPARMAQKSVVRVDLDRVERLVNLVGELVINQAMLSQSLEDAGLSPHSDAMNGLEEFQRLTRDIQDSVMMIRAQPVKSLFQRMARIVREASSAVGKNVRLATEGEATEIDKTVIERLADPLTHMIRNAVDHGLETPERRRAAGKADIGEIRLSAVHKSGRVIIRITDDGGGIDRARVLETARRKGLVPADAHLSETDIDNLLFLPGFSTAETVSDLSGRGVGMDVVKTAIAALGGRITIASQPGVGTSFTISLPLTLAVLDGMVIDLAGETLVIPLNSVVETLTLEDLPVEQLTPTQTVAEVRGECLPLFDLGAALGYRRVEATPRDAVALIIARETGDRAALIVDAIRDQRQVVIKGLGDGFPRAAGIAAATILGDGQIALIVDPNDILSNSSRMAACSAPPVSAGVSA